MTNGVERQTDRLHVLVVGTEAWAIDSVERALQHAGHEVVRCPIPPTGPGCPTLDGDTCGLPRLDLVCSVRARPLDRVLRSEQAVVCALRRGAPLILAGSAASSPFACFATTSVDLDGDVVGACEAAAAAGPVIRSTPALDELELLVKRRSQPGQPVWDQPVRPPVPADRDSVPS
ncbi:MAG: hypothetical protein JNK12_01495 [Acidimicrobiales bacterium]|nr:hypothetical protein [Acidimicrobiales bacterium]